MPEGALPQAVARHPIPGRHVTFVDSPRTGSALYLNGAKVALMWPDGARGFLVIGERPSESTPSYRSEVAVALLAWMVATEVARPVEVLRITSEGQVWLEGAAVALPDGVGPAEAFRDLWEASRRAWGSLAVGEAPYAMVRGEFREPDDGRSWLAVEVKPGYQVATTGQHLVVLKASTSLAQEAITRVRPEDRLAELLAWAHEMAHPALRIDRMTWEEVPIWGIDPAVPGSEQTMMLVTGTGMPVGALAAHGVTPAQVEEFRRRWLEAHPAVAPMTPQAIAAPPRIPVRLKPLDAEVHLHFLRRGVKLEG